MQGEAQVVAKHSNWNQAVEFSSVLKISVSRNAVTKVYHRRSFLSFLSYYLFSAIGLG